MCVCVCVDVCVCVCMCVCVCVSVCGVCVHHRYNESTAGADASVEALKLYHMKLTLALLGRSSS